MYLYVLITDEKYKDLKLEDLDVAALSILSGQVAPHMLSLELCYVMCYRLTIRITNILFSMCSYRVVVFWSSVCMIVDENTVNSLYVDCK